MSALNNCSYPGCLHRTKLICNNAYLCSKHNPSSKELAVARNLKYFKTEGGKSATQRAAMRHYYKTNGRLEEKACEIDIIHPPKICVKPLTSQEPLTAVMMTETPQKGHSIILRFAPKTWQSALPSSTSL